MTDADQGEPVTGEAVATVTGAEIAVREHGFGGIIRAASPDEILEKATVIANTLKGLIDKQNLAAPMGGGRKHVEVSAWQACGTMLGALGGQPLHAETVWARPVVGDDGVTPRRTTYTATLTRYPKGKGADKPVEITTYEVDGLDWEAFVEVRTAEGKVAGSAQGMVGRAESTWARREDYALRSMAETRAESRAYRRAIGWIIAMAGFSATPQEEMPTAAGPEFGPEASEERQGQMLRAMAFLFASEEVTEDPESLALAAFNKLGSTFGYMPEVVAAGIAMVAGVLKRAIEPEDGPGDHDAGAVTDATVVPDVEPDPALADNLTEPDPEDGPPPAPAHPDDPKIDF